MQPTTKICHEEQRKQSWCIFANAKFTQLNRWLVDKRCPRESLQIN